MSRRYTGTNGDTRVWDRQALLAEGNRLRIRHGNDGSGRADEAAEVLNLHDVYRSWLPEVLVSRCPFTGEAVYWPLDTVDLDGWYWEWENPTRERRDRVPATWLAMGGAVRLAEPVTSAPFDCMPGPDVPYVVPRLLERADTRAVIAEVPIGRHTGWAITYFTKRRPKDIALENLWGSKAYDVYDERGSWTAWGEHPQSRPDYAFELRPWLDAGKVLWIAPGDASGTLRRGSADCPYVDVAGTRRMQLIADGRIMLW